MCTTTTVPTYNRPPATYRFAPNYPPLQSGEKLIGNPTWSVTRHSDPLTLLGSFSGTPSYYTFTAADSYDVVISQATSLRTLYGRTAVTVASLPWDRWKATSAPMSTSAWEGANGRQRDRRAPTEDAGCDAGHP